MCGIVGYVGEREPSSLLVESLKHLEYRGYDSCGIAVLDNGTPHVVRAVGRIANLEQKLSKPASFHPGVHCGIGHTRWATHGRPSEDNAHPHQDCTGQFLVAHNGIIENYSYLRQTLLSCGHDLKTETDTEVLPHLIESFFHGNLEEAVRAALREVEGLYGIVVISMQDRQKIVVARKGAPIVLGLGERETFIASDVPALLPYTRDVMFLNDGDIAVVRHDSIQVCSMAGDRVDRPTEHISWSPDMAQKNGYPHFMLKEIFEQPNAVRDTLSGRLGSDDEIILEGELGSPELLSTLQRLYLVACGTSWHAALVGRYLIETLASLPVEVDYASEFRYRSPLLARNSMVVAISQSGETADTLAALHEGRAKGAHLLSICNVVGSMAARQSDSVLYTHAGPEIGVASTKAFTTQLVAFYLLALYLGRLRGVLSSEELQHRVGLLRQIPDQIERVLEQNEVIKALANRFCDFSSFLYLGRGISFPIALEGALKLKEISYIHAEGYSAGEMKHGPIALISKEMPVVVLAPCDPLYRKTMSNIEEVKVRDGIVLAVATEGDIEVTQKADHTLFIPPTDATLHPLLSVVALQLFAYHTAVARGCDVDKPRNLAKSVTVE